MTYYVMVILQSVLLLLVGWLLKILYNIWEEVKRTNGRVGRLEQWTIDHLVHTEDLADLNERRISRLEDRK